MTDVLRGVLAGIARHSYAKAPMEVLDRVHVSVDGGLDGDYRGAVKPGGRGRRQVSLMERMDWERTTAELGRWVAWQERRANLLVDGMDLPQLPGTRLRVGAVVLEITQECAPCSRMEAVAPGLAAALAPDWRGGALARVITAGAIAVGDEIRIEES